MPTRKNPSLTSSTQPSPAPVRGSGKRTLVIVLIVVALIAAAFGGGWLWGEIRLRQASGSWTAEREKMRAQITEAAGALSALRSVQAIWEIDSRVSEILGDLADDNYGLARDTAAETRGMIQEIMPSLDEGLRRVLGPLDGILGAIHDDAGTLSATAKTRAREARALIRAALGGPGAQPPSTPVPGAAGTRL